MIARFSLLALIAFALGACSTPIPQGDFCDLYQRVILTDEATMRKVLETDRVAFQRILNHNKIHNRECVPKGTQGRQ